MLVRPRKRCQHNTPPDPPPRTRKTRGGVGERKRRAAVDLLSRAKGVKTPVNPAIRSTGRLVLSFFSPVGRPHHHAARHPARPGAARSSDAGYLLRPSPSPAHAPSVANLSPVGPPTCVGRLGGLHGPCRRIQPGSQTYLSDPICGDAGSPGCGSGPGTGGGKARTSAKAREELGGARAAGRTARRLTEWTGPRLR